LYFLYLTHYILFEPIVLIQKIGLVIYTLIGWGPVLAGSYLMLHCFEHKNVVKESHLILGATLLGLGLIVSTLRRAEPEDVESSPPEAFS